MSAARPKPEQAQLIAEAAREYRAAEPRRSNDNDRPRASDRPPDELTQRLRADFVAECLDTVPLDSAHAQAALADGDLDRAFLHMQRLVLAVREAARTFKELRKASKTGAGE